ncbi:MAG: hypothetical protein H7Y31_10425 [Chitinophagaceae bacterium]|nr:hypothetical protein [Chitinophagaceae bacterium]
MKKITVTILSVLYMTIACGVMVNVHYCMGSLSSVEYGHGEEETCGKCGMKEKKGCCETEYKFVKLDGDHQLAKISIDFFQAPALLPSLLTDFSATPGLLSYLSLQYHSPPDPRVNEVYLHNCVFRI